MDKRFMAIIAAIIAVIVGIALFTGDSKDTGSTSSAATNHTLGAGTSNITLVEYGDYQCPGCYSYYPILKQVTEEYGDKITFQFRNYPLTNIHPNAYAAARAAEAASKQGKFWEMHDELYKSGNWTTWTASSNSNPQPIFEGYAKAIGLNIDKYKNDFKSSTVNSAIRADMSAGEKAGVDSTPTFILDGKKVQIANTFEAFKTVIDEAIKNKENDKE